MAKHPGRISSGELLLPSYTAGVPSRGRCEEGECSLRVRGARPPAVPQGTPYPPGHIFFRYHSLDRLAWLPGHLLSEQTGEAVGWGLFMGTRTSLAGAEPVCASIELSDEMSGPVWAGHAESQRRSPSPGARLGEGRHTSRPGGAFPGWKSACWVTTRRLLWVRTEPAEARWGW